MGTTHEHDGGARGAPVVDEAALERLAAALDAGDLHAVVEWADVHVRSARDAARAMCVLAGRAAACVRRRFPPGVGDGGGTFGFRMLAGDSDVERAWQIITPLLNDDAPTSVAVIRAVCDDADGSSRVAAVLIRMVIVWNQHDQGGGER